MNVPHKHQKQSVISEDLRTQNQGFAKRYFKLLNNASESKKPLNVRKSSHEDIQIFQQNPQNYKKSIEKW